MEHEFKAPRAVWPGNDRHGRCGSQNTFVSRVLSRVSSRSRMSQRSWNVEPLSLIPSFSRTKLRPPSHATRYCVEACAKLFRRRAAGQFELRTSPGGSRSVPFRTTPQTGSPAARDRREIIAQLLLEDRLAKSVAPRIAVFPCRRANTQEAGAARAEVIGTVTEHHARDHRVNDADGLHSPQRFVVNRNRPRFLHGGLISLDQQNINAIAREEIREASGRSAPRQRPPRAIQRQHSTLSSRPENKISG